MSKIFISYSHVAPDQDLARFFADHLQARGHSVFMDIQMVAGIGWAEEIAHQIRTADFFLVLLSKASIRRDMVRQEVKMAYELAQGAEKRYVILPVRVAFLGELPYDLGAYLDPLQYALWQEGEAYTMLGEQIIAAIEHAVALSKPGKAEEEFSPSGVQALYDATEAKGAPLPQIDPRLVYQLELETGAVKLDSPFYVKRQADAEIQRQIQRRGSTTIVKGARQMGKSSLLARAYAEAKRNRQQSCYLDLQLTGATHLANLETLLRYLAQRLSRSLQTSTQPNDYCNESLWTKDDLTEFIEDTILSEAELPILVLFDESDRVFHFPYREDFFGLIRGWHNRRSIIDRWRHFNVVIAHSTEPHLWIQDVTQSPFNVGFPIRLEDFDFECVSLLNSTHGGPLKTDKDIRDLTELIGGQPYLIRQALYMLVTNGWSLAQLQSVAGDDTGPFGDHLRQFLWYLHEHKELKEILRRVLYHGVCDDEMYFHRLRAAGLIRGETRDVVQMRCLLYEKYFKRHL